jgi:hypothetical protein
MAYARLLGQAPDITDADLREVSERILEVERCEEARCLAARHAGGRGILLG